MHKITVLTSSRADYSIYRPLLQLLHHHAAIKLQIVAFGTHTASQFGHTVDAIKADGFTVARELPFVLDGASPATISLSMAKTMEQFAGVWKELPTDLIICLGDRYEMFAAVAASISFAIPVAHIHGGETTLGAIDNIFRHSLTHMASLHFAGAEAYRQRIIALTGSEKNVFNTGALSIDNLRSLSLLTTEEFYNRYGVDLSKPTLLTTFHPETVSFDRNETYAKELCGALEKLSDQFQVLVTMPNADTMGSIIRKNLEKLADKKRGTVFAFENLGTIGYLSAMKHCTMLVGNTSSGFAEASWFPRWVVNLGHRQDGRLLTENIRTIAVDKNEIVNTVIQLSQQPVPSLQHPYGKGYAAEEMLKHILIFLESKTAD
ncbi:MAG: UDP-N-acetylglucosamine 2-epimerase [Flavisolibacter sp.]